MDMGNMTSKEIGDLTSKGLVSLGKQVLANGGNYADFPQKEMAKAAKELLEAHPGWQGRLQVNTHH